MIQLIFTTASCCQLALVAAPPLFAAFLSIVRQASCQPANYHSCLNPCSKAHTNKQPRTLSLLLLFAANTTAPLHHDPGARPLPLCLSTEAPQGQPCFEAPTLKARRAPCSPTFATKKQGHLFHFLCFAHQLSKASSLSHEAQRGGANLNAALP